MKPPEPGAYAREWLAYAETDLEGARVLLTSERPLPGPAAYHCQQAAEKALKAFLIRHAQPFAYTHELLPLLSSCVPIDASFSRLADAAATLTPYAIRFRYPSTSGSTALPLSEAQAALQLAEQVLQHVRERL